MIHVPLRTRSSRPPGARAVASDQQVKNNPHGLFCLHRNGVCVGICGPSGLPTSTACDIVRGL